jgi:hypothetical protein
MIKEETGISDKTLMGIMEQYTDTTLEESSNGIPPGTYELTEAPIDENGDVIGCSTVTIDEDSEVGTFAGVLVYSGINEYNQPVLVTTYNI